MWIARGHEGNRYLTQLNNIYSKPAFSILKANNSIFHSLYQAAGAPEMFFRQIEDCAKVSFLEKNPVHKQAINLHSHLPAPEHRPLCACV
jgi:hypothetical protein